MHVCEVQCTLPLLFCSMQLGHACSYSFSVFAYKQYMVWLCRYHIFNDTYLWKVLR